MKKIDFYSLVMQDKKKAAILHNGYTDGVFNYYKNDGGTWFAIHPETGLSVAQNYTRKAAAEAAHETDRMHALDRIMKNRGADLIKDFNTCITVKKIYGEAI